MMRPETNTPSLGRVLLAANAIASVGYGLYMSGSVIYFTKFVGFKPASVGFGLSLAALLWLPTAIPLGRLTDRLGHRRTAVASLVVQAAILAAGTEIRLYAVFLPYVVVLGFCEQITSVSRNALLASNITGDYRVRLLAQLRSSFNVGYTLGVLLCGIALSHATPTSYHMILLINAGASLATAAVLCSAPRIDRDAAKPPTRAPHRAPRDWAYIRLAILAGSITIADTALTVGVPLWVITSTHAPRASAAWVLTINTVLVVLLQVRLSRGASSVAGARRLIQRSCLASAVAFVIISASGHTPSAASAVTVAVAVIVYTLGELWSSAGLWKLRFDLAPTDAQGEYSAIFSISTTVRSVAGPLLVTYFVGDLKSVGWLFMAALFLLAFAATAPVVNSLVRARKDESGTRAAVTDEYATEPEIA